MTKKAIMKKEISAFDFACHEVKLYLDTHPNDMKAIALLGKYRTERKAAVTAYEKLFGPYIENSRDVKPGMRWNWTEGPWPWEFKEEEA